jgi:hypothetical protein
LSAKVQALRSPPFGSAVTNLINLVDWMEMCFGHSAIRFERNAVMAQSYIGDRRYAQSYNIPIVTQKDVSRLIKLSAKALEVASDLREAVNQLSRGKNQVMVVEETNVGWDTIKPQREGPDDIPPKQNLH